jgi:hypothetical protein
MMCIIADLIPMSFAVLGAGIIEDICAGFLVLKGSAADHDW